VSRQAFERVTQAYERETSYLRSLVVQEKKCAGCEAREKELSYLRDLVTQLLSARTPEFYQAVVGLKDSPKEPEPSLEPYDPYDLKNYGLEPLEPVKEQ
jgi:hypothetical protein